MNPIKQNRVLVTGGGTLLGMNIAAALLAEGAEVTLLVRPGTEDRIGPLAQRVRWYVADVWDPASLRGRGRGHATVIHTVGSMIAEPSQGLTYHRLNVVSARNVTNMCINDGVPHLVFMSGSSAPWISRQYIHAKREAESYIRRVGLSASLVRAPILYMRGDRRPLFYSFISLLARIPPLSWTPLKRVAPMPMDVLARGVARIALEKPPSKGVFFASDIRKRNKREELRGQMTAMQAFGVSQSMEPPRPYESLNEDTPFGWMPQTPDDDNKPRR